MQKEVRRSVISGKCDARPSIAFAHRCLIIASFSPGQTVVSGLPFSPFIDATLSACRSFGADIMREGEIADIFAPEEPSVPSEIDFADSNSTLKLFLPICSTFGSEMKLKGSERLSAKIIAPFLKYADRLGATVPDDALTLPVSIKGPVTETTLPYFSPLGTQFLSGILLASPMREEESSIAVEGKIFGTEYVDGTLAIMQACGIDVVQEGRGAFRIAGSQPYAMPDQMAVPSSPFLSSFPLLAGALCGKAEVKGGLISEEFEKLLLAFGAKVSHTDEKVFASAYSLDAAQLDALSCADYLPHALVLAAHSSGKTAISNIEQIGMRRQNRLLRMSRELSKMGVKFSDENGNLIVEGNSSLAGAGIEPEGDAHVAAACAIAGLSAKTPTTISGAECIEKGYPGFFSDLVSLGAIVR